MADEAHICDSCRKAVLRTYREMLEKGRDETSALRTAMQVLALRHPEQRPSDRADALGRWLSAS